MHYGIINLPALVAIFFCRFGKDKNKKQQKTKKKPKKQQKTCRFYNWRLLKQCKTFKIQLKRFYSFSEARNENEIQPDYSEHKMAAEGRQLWMLALNVRVESENVCQLP